MILVLLAAAILTACAFWIFPFIEPFVSPPPPETVGN
jgi:hypothetical protein